MVFNSYAYRTILHCAARKCKGDIINEILKTGQLHPNQQDQKGDTALHIAVENENVEAIHIFLNVPGVKFNIRNTGISSLIYGVSFLYFSCCF